MFRSTGTIMALYYIILGAGLLLFTGSVLWALRWALVTGQFRNPAKTALQIFDEDEPIGQMTDHFPGERRVQR